MKGNQGLEALAALCGGVTRANETPPSQSNSNNGSENSSTSISFVERATAGVAPAPVASLPSIVSGGSVPALDQSTTSPFGNCNRISAIPAPNGGDQSCTNQATTASIEFAQQQIQQAIAAASAYGTVQNPAQPQPQPQPPQATTTNATAAPATTAYINGGVGFQGTPSVATSADSGVSTATAVQQLAYYHYIQAQAAMAAQLSQTQGNRTPTTTAAPPAAHMNLGTLIEPNTAIALALAGQAIKQPPALSSIPPAGEPTSGQLAPAQQQQQHVSTVTINAPASSPTPVQVAAITHPKILPNPPPGTAAGNQSDAQATSNAATESPNVGNTAQVITYNAARSTTLTRPSLSSPSIAPSPLAAVEPQKQNGRSTSDGLTPVTARSILASSKLPQPPLLQRPSVPDATKFVASAPAEATSPGGSAAAAAAAVAALSTDDKKQLKRAANRRSAQLSRKRKKQFIEELKEENDQLRRKEQILKSIPDLIVVFDSAGTLWFVSHSVKRFLDFEAHELEGASFWDRLCDESVRLLKAAFMDALAMKKKDSDTAPLGSGVWELRLVDRDNTHKLVALNGVVHFSGETPECVCSIRPRDEHATATNSSSSSLPTQHQVMGHSTLESQPAERTLDAGGVNREVADVALHAQYQSSLIRAVINPQQSVVVSSSSVDDASVKIEQGIAPPPQNRIGTSATSSTSRRTRDSANPISDGESAISDSSAE